MILNLFVKYPIPDKLSPEMQKVTDELRELGSKEEVLERAYEILTLKYKGMRFATYVRLPLLFVHDTAKLWAKSGFLYCTAMNYLLRVLLVKSGWFLEEDIQRKYSLVWYISIHQYLRVRISDSRYINVDIWNASYGKRLGDYARGFH